MLDKGELHYRNVLLSLNTFHYGLTDYWNINTGFEIFTLMASLFSNDEAFLPSVLPLGIGTKLGLPLKENLYISGGLTYLGLYSQGLIVANMTLTLGHENHNMSVSWLPLLAQNDYINQMVLLSGMTRVNKKLVLVSENWLSSQGITSIHGIRHLSNRSSFDLGLLMSNFSFNTFNKNRFRFAPVVGFTVAY